MINRVVLFCICPPFSIGTEGIASESYSTRACNEHGKIHEALSMLIFVYIFINKLRSFYFTVESLILREALTLKRDLISSEYDKCVVQSSYRMTRVKYNL